MVIRVLVPAGSAHPAIEDDAVTQVAYGATVELVALMEASPRGGDTVVLMRSADRPVDEEAIAVAIRNAPCPVIEVLMDRWDGQEHSPVSAACRGVIAGFGVSGVAAAVALLKREAGTRPT